MQKRTKIIATLGPASSTADTVLSLIEAGTDVFRINFSHGSKDEHRQRVELVRSAAKQCGAHVALMGDLQGPKIRIAGFRNNHVELRAGDAFILDTQHPADSGDNTIVGVGYKKLPEDCNPGQTLLLDDGRLQLAIEKITGSQIHTRVVVGGVLHSKKGINLLGGGLSAPALTEKDLSDLKFATELNLDYLAVSFPRSAADIDEARRQMKLADCNAFVIAKIERAEAVSNNNRLDDIIRSADGVMVARGDLGVEIGDAELIGVQKKVILRARQLDRVVITATQMMETMIENPIPTRAEVFDVANAVLDGTDAVMLSAETAMGKHPVKVVEAMSRIIIGAEKERVAKVSSHRMNQEFKQIDEAIAMATMYAANHMPRVRAIVCLTESGNTPLWMSRIRSGIPIYGMSEHQRTLNRMALLRGVNPRFYDMSGRNRNGLLTQAIRELKDQGAVQTGDLVLGTRGDLIGRGGLTNTLKVLEVS